MVGLLAGLLAGTTAVAATLDAAVSADTAASTSTAASLLPPGISLWNTSLEVRGAAGYKDNVFLSHLGAIDSAFWLTDLDFFAFRLPVDGTEVTFLFSGEDRRFLTMPQPHKEQTFLADAAVKKDYGNGWHTGMELEYSYVDEVFDVSATGIELGPIPVRGQGLALRPSVRRDLGDSVDAELEFDLERQYFSSPLDDYWNGGPKLTLRRSYGTRSEVALSYEVTRLYYDTRLQTTQEGVLLPGTGLAFEIQRIELDWRHHWDAERRFRTVLKLGAELNRDNGGGYFDFKRYYASEEFRVRWAGWELRLEGGLNFYDFYSQPLSLTDLSNRSKFGVMANCRLEKHLTQKLSWFAQYEHEHWLANLDLDKFRVNTVFSGLGFEF